MKPLLEIKRLKKYFPIRRGFIGRTVGHVKAVDNISFTLHEREIVGLVGESGSGKSTAAQISIALIPPTEGQVIFMGHHLNQARRAELRYLRQKMQMVFQDPLSSLSPRKTILENMGEALIYHGLVKNRDEQIDMVSKLLERIGMPLTALNRYPHQFSGGQQQRISIGRALALNPKLIVCDEAVSALDLSVQAQILNLLFELKEMYQLSYLFISHDLSVVRHLCDRILVMYRGKIVEEGTCSAIFEDPQHDYTKQLIRSAPRRFPRRKER